MSFETERDVIRQRLYSQWGSITEISWDGFNGSPYLKREGVEFIRPRVEDGESEWVGIAAGMRRERKYGTLVIDVFQPIGTGDERGVQLCDSLIAIFSPCSTGPVRFDRRGWAYDVGIDLTMFGQFYVWRVFLPYYREATVPYLVAPEEGVGVLQNETAHGFSAHNLIRWNGTAWVKAIATASTTLADAIVVQVVNANQFMAVYLAERELELTSHGMGGGGVALYLSASTAGLVTSTAPSNPGEYVQQVGRVKNANALILQSTAAVPA